MIGKLLRASAALFTYFCIATILSQAIGITLLLATGRLDAERLAQMAAIAQGIDLIALAQETAPDVVTESTEQLSYEEVTRDRALRLRGIELRLLSLRKGLDLVVMEQDQLSDEKRLVNRVREEFLAELAQRHDEAILTGQQDVRRIWENVRPRQAKELILQMIDAGEVDPVVKMISDMPIAKKAKIIGEFKTPEETEKLEEILQLLLQGEPEVSLIDDTRDQLQPTAPVTQ